METTLGQAEWRKSSHSGQTGNCVEVAGNLPGAVAVRDSQDPVSPVLIVSPAAWRALTRKVRNGELNLALTLSALPKSLGNRGSSHSTARRRTQVQPGGFAGTDARAPGGARMHGRKPAACCAAGAHRIALGRLRLRSC